MRAFYTTIADKLEQYFSVDARYFLSGGFWLTLGQGVTILFGVITTALFAHYLSEANYGIYKYLIGVAALLSSLSLTGLGQSILQTAAKKYYGFYQQTLSTNFVYSLPVAIISLITGVYYYINENLTLTIGCLLIALLQPLINTVHFIQPFLQGSRRYRESVVLHTLQIAFISLFSLITLYITKNIIWLFGAYLITQLLSNLFAHLYFHPAVQAIPVDIKNKYLKYAKHTSLRNLVASISNRADTIIVFTQLGAIELALYSIAIVIPEQIKGSFKNLASLLLPKYAQHSNIILLKKSVPMRSLQMFLLLSIITTVYIIIAPDLYALLFPKYLDAVLYSQIAALAFPTFILYIPYSILQSQLEESILYKITIYTSLLQIIFLLIFIFNFGLIGAIIARILHRVGFLIVTFWYLYKI